MTWLLAYVTKIPLALVHSSFTSFTSFSIITEFPISSLLGLTVWAISWNMTWLLTFEANYFSFAWTISWCFTLALWTVISKVTWLLTFIAYRVVFSIFGAWTFLILKFTFIRTFRCYVSWLFTYITYDFRLTSLLIFRGVFPIRTSWSNMTRLFAYMTNNSFFRILKMISTFFLFIYSYIFIHIL